MERRIPEGARERLTPLQYDVCANGATEPPFTGRYVGCKDEGTYLCACCGAELFPSGAKYDSGTGWPSFTGPASAGAVACSEDSSAGMLRTEASCGRCGAHLGHVFGDGPAPAGTRYCINSASLELRRAAGGPNVD